MKALTWQGKNSVKLGMFRGRCSYYIFISASLMDLVETAKPRIIEDRDVIVKVTGSTICGSDLHLYHGMGYYLKLLARESDQLIVSRRRDHRDDQGRYPRPRVLRRCRKRWTGSEECQAWRARRGILPDCLR